jgi:hypothetical protein
LFNNYHEEYENVVMGLQKNKKKLFAYVLILCGFLCPIFVNVYIDQILSNSQIHQRMYESPSGIRSIISIIDARIAGAQWKGNSLTPFVFYGFGCSYSYYRKNQ